SIQTFWRRAPCWAKCSHVLWRKAPFGVSSKEHTMTARGAVARLTGAALPSERHGSWACHGGPLRGRSDGVTGTYLCISRTCFHLREKDVMGHCAPGAAYAPSAPPAADAASPAHNPGGAVLQLAGSAPIFVPRSAKLFIVSVMNTPRTGGVHSPGIDTIRTW